MTRLDALLILTIVPTMIWASLWTWEMQLAGSVVQ